MEIGAYRNSNNIANISAVSANKKTPISEVGVCKTCANRTYQDGSNDIGVSFKTPTHISPSNAPSAVASHEQEHVANNERNAQKSGGEVLFQNVTLNTSICPECKRVYISGGVTKSAISAPKEKGNNVDIYA
ncbi:hypothetical protein [uncultured Brachyspira sp.]|uniref:hypothetical protein n=1 Tax=uncultured Brachyspira sp. TaxID=221953 RepID=UPI00261F543D|nr:hypothetical protein [uncultured Brachyspira sp.]